MNLRKNNFSYFVWVLLLFFTSASCAFFGLVLAQMVNMNFILTAGGLVTLFFAVVFGLYLLIGYFLEHNEKKPHWVSMLDLSLKLERILMITLLAIGFVARVLLIENAGEDAAYFEVCKVTADGGLSVQSVQGSVYFYCLILHGLYHVIGNHWIAGIWLQIILQLIGAFIICLGLRKIMNKVPAYLVYAYILFSPTGIMAGLTYSPQMLYFCIFAGVFYFVADYLKRSVEIEESKTFMWFYTVIIGLMIGFCCYTDISGVILLFLWIVLPMVKRSEYNNVWGIRMVVGIVVAVLMLTGLLFLDALLSHTTIGNILRAWTVLYGEFEFSFDILLSKLNLDFIILVTFSCVGCFSFWRRANTERFTPYILMTLGMSAIVFSGITTENMSGSYLLCVLLATLASVSITEMFCAEDLVKKSAKNKEEIEEVDDNTIKKIEFIENPLPVPKKHVRKTMDYAFIPDESQMKYDIQVSDYDDYDLKI